MRQRYCKVCLGWHDLSAAWPAECVREVAPVRSALPMPMVIGDAMPPAVHPYDQRTHDAKSTWRRANRAGGYAEVGNDPSRFKTPERKSDRAGIRESLKRAKARVGI